MTLRFGLTVDSQAAPPDDLGAFLDSELLPEHMVREAGWDSIWVVHHDMPEQMKMPQPGPWLGRLVTEIGDREVGVVPPRAGAAAAPTYPFSVNRQRARSVALETE